MSLANYLRSIGNVEKVFSVDAINIEKEPSSVDDGARISDCLEYLGNGTYPQTTTQLLAPSTTYVPVFQRPGIDLSGDFLRVRPVVDLFNFQQLLNFEYSLNVISNSKSKFDMRFTIYDLDLNILETYDPVRYDPSSNPFQPPALESFTFKGYSVQIPAQAEYGFVEISGAGSLNVTFDYANSQLVNALDNSDPNNGTPTGSRSSKNIFVVDWFAQPFDVNISGDILSLEADVTQLQADVAQIDVSLNLLETGYVKTDGSEPMTGALQVNGSLYSSGWSQGILLGDGARASLIEGTDPDPSFNPAIGIYSNKVDDQKSVYLWTGDKAGNQKLNPQSVWEDATAVIEDEFVVNVPLEANAGLTVSGGIINQTSITGFNVFRAPIIADFGIDMNGNGIGSLLTPTIPSMATNKEYVDTADNLRLPLSGGTMSGSLNMNSQNINNVPNPTLSQQPTTKIYVDTALNGKLNTTGGILSGALNMGSNQINNLSAPSVASDAANKAYVDGIIVSGAFLPKSGGTMTGSINMGSNQINNLANPDLPTDAATKSYVDSATQNELPLTGGTMAGSINMADNRIINIPTTPVSNSDAVNGTYVQSSIAGYALPLTGGTLTGSLGLTNNRITNLATPVLPTDAVTKAYVDAIDPTGGYLPLAGGTMTGSIDMGNSPITNIGSSNNPAFTGAAQYTQMLSYMTGNYPATSLPPVVGYLPRDGSVPMTVDLPMGGNGITNLRSLSPTNTNQIGINGHLNFNQTWSIQQATELFNCGIFNNTIGQNFLEVVSSSFGIDNGLFLDNLITGTLNQGATVNVAPAQGNTFFYNVPSGDTAYVYLTNYAPTGWVSYYRFLNFGSGTLSIARVGEAPGNIANLTGNEYLELFLFNGLAWKTIRTNIFPT